MGMKITFPGLSGAPAVTVVGVARSDTQTADACVVPSQGPALTAPGSGGYQMLYRSASTLTSAHPDLTETSHHIAVTSGTDVTVYVEALNKDLTPLGATAQAGGLDAGGDMVVRSTRCPRSAMGDSVGLRLPGSVIAVHHGAELFPLTLGGLLIATLGVLLPAGWAARTRTATALRTE
ncbi:hypothetical protein [Streptomyces massasporeus]|uniref:hypothetical protein n=1 Tax=Streptomyces massasporeus TaxID=67324 RepID=UPI0019B6B483|nr:hypothetical protein [Streptomyces massasporeus]GGV81788.1 hypothetical protein GCM10010228_55490 [Streptomyces massasporeus]